MVDDLKEQAIMKPYPPLGILYISAWLKKHGFSPIIFDSTFSDFQAQQDFILNNPPDIIGIYSNLMTRPNVVKLIRFIRKAKELANCKVVVGGPEVTYHAEKLLEQGADFIVIGEGEQTMLQLVRYLDGNTEKIEIKTIPGLVYLDDSKTMVKTPERLLLKSLDELPQPDRMGIHLSEYISCWEGNHGYSAINVSTMRGCPYTCKWCSRAVYGQSYRRRSPALVVEELEDLTIRYPGTDFWFVDDVFTISHKWLKEFAEALKKKQVQIRYECITRADRMNTEVIGLLKESGCFRVWIGAESGSQRILDAMDRRVKAEQVGDMIRAASKAGIETGTFIMLGYPGETIQDIRKTIRHLIDSKPNYYTITHAYPIKGTPFYEEIESTIKNELPWAATNDRQNSFEGAYSDAKYKWLLRWLHNSVLCHDNRKPITIRAVAYVKAITSKFVIGISVRFTKIQ